MGPQEGERKKKVRGGRRSVTAQAISWEKAVKRVKEKALKTKRQLRRFSEKEIAVMSRVRMRMSYENEKRLSRMQATEIEKRLSRMQATKNELERLSVSETQATENEKRLSRMQATEFLKAKFKNEFEFIKAEQQAQQTVLAKHQQQQQKSQMKGGKSSFASKYQPPSVEEECPTAKEGFGKIHYDETTGAFHSLSAATVARDAKVTEEVSTLHSADAKLRDQPARNRTSIEELEMKLKEELLRLERDHEGKLDESRQQLYKVHNELSDTLDARLVEHVGQMTRIVDDKHDKALRQVAASAEEFDSKIKHLQDERNHHHEAKIQTIAESIEILHENENQVRDYFSKTNSSTAELDAARTTAKTLAMQLKLSRCAEDEELEADKVYFNTFVHDCQAKAVHWSEVTKYLTETILSLSSKASDLVAVKDLDSQRQKLEPKFVELRRNIDAITHKERSLQSKMDSITKYNGKVLTISGETDRLLTEAVEHKGALDNQLYNAKQLVDNMNKSKVLKQILIQRKDREMATLTDNLKNIDKATQNMKTDRAKHNRLAKEKVDAKADMQRQINALDAQVSDLQLNKAVLQAIDEMLVALVEEEKDDIIMRNIIELDEKFYIQFAQFEQRQKEMDRNTMKTINVRTDQSMRKIVIRTPPKDAAQCFDVACENAMARWRTVQSLCVCTCTRPRTTQTMSRSCSWTHNHRQVRRVCSTMWS